VLAALAALAHETRLDVFRLLVRAGPEGLAAGELARRLDIPPATLSFHLKELRNGGVVTARREGRSVVYAPGLRAMGELVAWLGESCCEEPARRRVGGAAGSPKKRRARR